MTPACWGATLYVSALPASVFLPMYVIVSRLLRDFIRPACSTTQPASRGPASPEGTAARAKSCQWSGVCMQTLLWCFGAGRACAFTMPQHRHVSTAGLCQAELPRHWQQLSGPLPPNPRSSGRPFAHSTAVTLLVAHRQRQQREHSGLWCLHWQVKVAVQQGCVWMGPEYMERGTAMVLCLARVDADP
jgi:hypothetical protein